MALQKHYKMLFLQLDFYTLKKSKSKELKLLSHNFLLFPNFHTIRKLDAACTLNSLYKTKCQ